jgi:hypothetical protein
MNQRRTTSILQRVPVILAVTAASYGLQPQDKKKPREGGCVHSRTRERQLQLASAA